MATIGLDKLYYSKITEDTDGNETYGTPTVLAKAMTADLSVELNEATLYADDGAAEIVKEFKSGTLSLGIDDIGSAVASDLTGSTIDSNGVIVSASEDGGDPVAVGFRAKKSNGKYRYYWLYKVKFGIPATNLATNRLLLRRIFKRCSPLWRREPKSTHIIRSTGGLLHAIHQKPCRLGFCQSIYGRRHQRLGYQKARRF